VAEHEEISIIDEIRRLAAAAPFVPFSITMASGHQYPIGPRDGLIIGNSTISVFLHRAGIHLLRQNHISEVSAVEESS